QAVEAKEAVPIQRENQTLASITFQNYFRMYERLAGMTGTADTEAFEFQQIYHLETVVIPTHLTMIRKDENDLVFRTLQEKVDAILGDIKDCHERGQPVLVGTTSIENSEMLSGHLEKQKLPHQVLNAKQHAREAEIVAQAGRPKMVTIATNMAGRGTDIVLGGAVESRNFDIRKQLLEYDDVANDQRRVIYQQRDELLEAEEVSETIRNMIAGQIEDTARLYVAPESVEEQWDIPGLEAALTAQYEIKADVTEWMKAEPELTDEVLRERLRDVAL